MDQECTPRNQGFVTPVPFTPHQVVVSDLSHLGSDVFDLGHAHGKCGLLSWYPSWGGLRKKQTAKRKGSEIYFDACSHILMLNTSLQQEADWGDQKITSQTIKRRQIIENSVC